MPGHIIHKKLSAEENADEGQLRVDLLHSYKIGMDFLTCQIYNIMYDFVHYGCHSVHRWYLYEKQSRL